MSYRNHLLALIGTLFLGACSTTEPVPPCCYAGAVTTTRLTALQATTDDGRLLGFAEVFPGYAPEEGIILRPLPFNEVQRADIIYSSIEPLLPVYDANGDDWLEKPEVLVLYAREAALAMGTPIRHFGADTPVWAVSAPTADIGGLVTWVQARRGSMSKEGQALFSDLELLGQDLKTGGNDNGAEGGIFLVR